MSWTSDPTTTGARWRRAASLALLPLCFVGCTAAAAQPEVTVTCRPKKITLQVKNVSDQPARYTVTVAIDRDGLVDTESYSTDLIAAGKTQVVTDDRPDDREVCKVASTKVFS